MGTEIWHHGILGQKWGVRRTPEELGHISSGSKGGSDKSRTKAKEAEKKTPGKAAKSSRVMSDEELRQRINRLNMEEQYDNLVARKNARDTSKVKKALGDAFEKFGRGLLDTAVDKALEKMFNKEDKFDIDDWKNADVNTMDSDTIQKVSKWYQNARSITSAREELKPSSSSSSSSSSASSSSSSSSSSSPSSASIDRMARYDQKIDAVAAMMDAYIAYKINREAFD